MGFGKFSLAKAAGLLVVAAAHGAVLADTGTLRCDPASRWEDFSSVEMTVRSDGSGGQPAGAMTLEMALHDDGLRMIATHDGHRVELIQLQRPMPVTLSSEPTGPAQLVESDMIFAVPYAAAKRQAQRPCDLRANTRYPVDFTVDDDTTVTGEVGLEGNTVHVAVEDKGPRGNLSFTGRFAFQTARGPLPSDLALRGWTIFRKGVGADDGEASRFDTLGELLNSLAAPAAK